MYDILYGRLLEAEDMILPEWWSSGAVFSHISGECCPSVLSIFATCCQQVTPFRVDTLLTHSTRRL